MTIQDIKSNLSLRQVLYYYNLQPNKNKMLLCPFHDDTTPSLQVNLDKNYYKCHACDKKGDQIQFVQDMEKCNKHEALLKCTALAGNNPEVVLKKPVTMKSPNFLEQIYETFVKSIYLSIQGKEYLKSRALEDLLKHRGMVGFNSGQFHHAGRFENEENPEEVKKALIEKAVEAGLLIPLNRINNRTGEAVTYRVFGNKSLVFPLRNKQGEIVSFYFRSIIDSNDCKHLYLKNRQGIYPHYPKPNTKKLILTEAIIDAVSLLQIKEITQEYSIVACYGTNGLTDEILSAIKELKELEEIIFIFDQDKAGEFAVNKYAKELVWLEIKQSKIKLPNKDVNETLQLHEKEIFIELLENRQPVISNDSVRTNSFSIEDLSEKIVNSSHSEQAKQTDDLDHVKEITENQNIREKVANSQKPIDFLKTPNLLKNINELLGQIGIVGEEENRLLQFITATTYKMNYNLHILYQGSSGSGKTHTIKQVSLLIPPEDVIYLTRVTESSLYNYKNGEFMYKLVIFEDLDGLKEEALMAVREMISNKKLSSSTSIKDKKGNADGKIREVEVSFASLSATTKGELYEDNMSRIIVLSVDESQEQTQRIIAYKNLMYQGKIDKKKQEKTRLFLRDCIRLLQPFEVINPFAHLVELPENVHKPTRMHDLVMGVINQIVILNQYQREKTKDNALIAKKEDVINGLQLMKNSIILKMDELEGKIRTFYEALKKYVETKAKKADKKREDVKFTRFDIKDSFLLSKTQINSYLQQLSYSEYLQKIGHSNKGYSYKIAHWDNFKGISELELQVMLAKMK
jgi:DNA primase catalytic core